MAKLWMIRHAQARFGAEDYDSLSPLGERQSQILGAYLKSIGFSADLYATGGLKRHHQTLDYIQSALGTPQSPLILDAFGEYRHEDILNAFDHSLLPRIKQAFQTSDPETALKEKQAFMSLYYQALERWMSGRHDPDYAEPFSAFETRIQSGLKALMELSDRHESILIVTSAGPISATLAKVLSMPTSLAFQMGHRLYNSSVHQLITEQGQWRLHQFNSLAHIEAHSQAELKTYI